MRTAGSFIDGVPRIATWTVSPDCALNCAASSLVARLDSVSGAEKFVEKLGPSDADSTFIATRATTQANTTSQRRR